MKRLFEVALIAIVANPVLGAQAAPSATDDRYGAIRHVKLNPSGSVWIGFGGQARERIESWNNFNFGVLPAAPTAVKANDVFAMTRFLASADLHATSRFRLFTQVKSSLSTNRELAGGRRTSDVDEIDVHQLFADLRFAQPGANGTALTLRGGRLELAFGRERLVSDLDWANTRRNFEGATAALSRRTATVTGFWAQPVRVRPYEMDRRDSSTTLFGLYGTARPRSNMGVDAYWIGQRRDAGVAVWNGTPGRELRHTVGTRLWRPATPESNIDLEAEAAVQFGEVGSNSISARMFTGQAGYTFWNTRRAPRLYANVDYASGDDAAAGEVGTFSQLNPQPHPFLGFADIAGRQNVVDLSGGGSMRVWRTTALADYHVLRRASAADAFYAKSGGVARPAGFGTSKDIASELDVTVRYPVDRYLLLLTGWSHVFPGGFIKQGGAASGADKPINVAYLTLQYTL
jgi:hypothetical protein